MADKIAVLRLGELEQFGAPLELYNRPENIFVAGFIGSPKMNFVAGRVAEGDRTVLEVATGERMVLPSGGFAQRPGQAVTLGVRPVDLQPVQGGTLTMQVRSVEQLGGESYIYGHLTDATPITLHSPGQTQVNMEETIQIGPINDQLHLFDTETGRTLRMD